MITIGDLAILAPGASPVYADALNQPLERFHITGISAAAFLAQVIHESAGLRTFSENLNYSAVALPGVFGPTRFPPAVAAHYGRTSEHPADQVGIANIAYANRMGNGPSESGDGWRFRGRGPIQLTGKVNYLLCGAALGLDLLANPDLLLIPINGCLAAGWFWNEGNRTGKSLNRLGGDIDAISKIVNGGSKGLHERRALFEVVLRVVK